jgi:hypothetical protein
MSKTPDDGKTPPAVRKYWRLKKRQQRQQKEKKQHDA